MPATAGAKKKKTTGGDAPPSRRMRGSVAVHEALREDILSLRIEPGRALDEVALAARFGLSRTPIREALIMLEREDLVTFLPNRSAIVTPFSMTNTHEYLDTLTLMSRGVYRLAATSRRVEDLKALSQCLEMYKRAAAGRDVHAVVAADLAFHKRIADAGRNGFLGKFYSLTLDYGRRMYLLHYYPLFDDQERALSIAQHTAIAEAIEERDVDGAERLGVEHITAELRVIQRSLEPVVGDSVNLGTWGILPAWPRKSSRPV